MIASHAKRLVDDLDVGLERLGSAAELPHRVEEFRIVASVRRDVAPGVRHDDPELTARLQHPETLGEGGHDLVGKSKVLEEVLAVNAPRAGGVERKPPPHVPTNTAGRVDHEVDGRPAIALVKPGAEVERESVGVPQCANAPSVRWR
jgi:hypothetical protein